MKKLVVLLGIAVLAAVVWRLASSEAEPVPAGSGAGSESEGVAPSRVAEGVEVREDLPRLEVEESGVASGIRMIEVSVVRRGSGEPVPGAEVWWHESIRTSELEGEALEEYLRLRLDREQVALRYGTSLVADEGGRVLIPLESYVRMTGRRGDLYGELNVRLDEQTQDTGHRLELEADSSLVVQVVDSLGRPAADVPVGIVRQVGDERDAGAMPLQQTVSRAPDGMARVPHLQIRMRNLNRMAPARFLLRAMIPGLTEGGLPFDPDQLTAEPVVLRLPPAGRVTVKLTDVGGKPLSPESLRTGVDLFVSDPEASQVRPGPSWRSVGKDDGTQVFERVVAGKAYHVSALPSGQRLDQAFEGPLNEGHEVTVTLSLENEQLFLVGRAVDGSGKPRANMPLALSFEAGNRGGSGWSFETDEDGYFKVNLRARSAEQIVLEQYLIQDHRGIGPSDAPVVMASWKGRRELVAGENDLGDVVLEIGPVVATGRVRVDGEAPEDGARIPMQVESVQRLDRWWPTGDLKLAILEGGRFQVHGVPESSRYRLAVSGLSFLPVEPVEFAPGAEGLQIDLETGGSLVAEVLGDEVLGMPELRLILVAMEGQERGVPEDPVGLLPGDRLKARFAGQEGERFRFRWDALWAGAYRLEVSARGGSVLFEAGEIRIRPGGSNEDPRLPGIDLRGKLRSIAVRLRDTEERPVLEPALVLVRSRAGELHGFSLWEGRTAILTGDPYVDLVVAAQGFRPKEVPAVGRDTTVTLERFPEVEVRVRGGLPDLPEGTVLRVGVTEPAPELESGTYVDGGFPERSVDLAEWYRPPQTVYTVEEAGDVRVPVAGSGVYRVRVWVQNEETRRSSTVRGVEPEEVRLPTSEGGVIEVRLPEEGLRSAIQAAGGR